MTNINKDTLNYTKELFYLGSFIIIIMTIINILLISVGNAFADSNKNNISKESTKSNINISIPENIEHLEYCYVSNQCEVPSEYISIIEKNINTIKKGGKSIY